MWVIVSCSQGESWLGNQTSGSSPENGGGVPQGALTRSFAVREPRGGGDAAHLAQSFQRAGISIGFVLLRVGRAKNNAPSTPRGATTN